MSGPAAPKPDPVRAATDAAALARTARKLAGFLAADRPETRAALAARTLHREYDLLARRHPPRQAVDCRVGCTYCCHQTVSARAWEVLALAAAIRALPEAEREAIRTRIGETARTIAGMAVPERHRRQIPCPLLEDGRCRLYPARPLACRSFASHDVGACAAAFAGEPARIPVPGVNAALRRFFTAAAEHAARTAGVPDDQYELVAALALALEDPASEARWTAGEDVFRTARARDLVAPASAAPPGG